MTQLMGETPMNCKCKTALIIIMTLNFNIVMAQFNTLEQLRGHCWQAPFPDGKRIDTHCFSDVFGGAHLKDEHIVCGPGEPYYGETWYSAEGKDSTVTFRYFNSLSGFSQGGVIFDGQYIYFPEENYQQGDKEVTYKTIWTLKKNQYISEMLQQDDQHEKGWKPVWSMVFKKVNLANVSAVARNEKHQLYCHNDTSSSHTKE